MKLLLFDGTLIQCGGAGRAALAQAVEKLIDAQIMKHVRLAGGTDYGIFDAIFLATLVLPTDIDEIERD